MQLDVEGNLCGDDDRELNESFRSAARQTWEIKSRDQKAMPRQNMSYPAMSTGKRCGEKKQNMDVVT